MKSQMYDIPLQNPIEYCDKCETLKKILEKEKLEQPDLGEFRETCSKCRWGGNGIYKADIVYKAHTLHSSHKLPKGKGRHSVIPKNAVKAILEQIKEGKTYAEIARVTGYSKATICRIAKKNQNQED